MKEPYEDYYKNTNLDWELYVILFLCGLLTGFVILAVL